MTMIIIIAPLLLLLLLNITMHQSVDCILRHPLLIPMTKVLRAVLWSCFDNPLLQKSSTADAIGGGMAAIGVSLMLSASSAEEQEGIKNRKAALDRCSERTS